MAVDAAADVQAVPDAAVTAAVQQICRIVLRRRISMLQVNAKIDGMMCGMCEAHCKDAVRQAFPNAKKISASASSGDLEFIIQENLPTPVLKHELKTKLDSIGYKLLSVSASEAAEQEKEKKGFFSRLRHK